MQRHLGIRLHRAITLEVVRGVEIAGAEAAAEATAAVKEAEVVTVDQVATEATMVKAAEEAVVATREADTQVETVPTGAMHTVAVAPTEEEGASQV